MGNPCPNPITTQSASHAALQLAECCLNSPGNYTAIKLPRALYEFVALLRTVKQIMFFTQGNLHFYSQSDDSLYMQYFPI